MAAAKKQSVPTVKPRARSAPAGTVMKIATPSKQLKKPVGAQNLGKSKALASMKAAPCASAVTPAAVEPPPRRRADYQAIERDYRTGAFTDQELADKYGNVVSRQAITKMAKVKGWKKDLTVAVRQATRAALIAEEATKKVAFQVAQGSKATVDAVVAAAETNRRVILEHRDDIRRARQLSNQLLEELVLITVAPSKITKLVDVLQADEQLTASETLEARQALGDLMKLPARILSAQRLAQVMGRLQPLERRAFGLDDDVPPPPDDELTELSDEELDRRTEELLERRRSRQ